MCVCAFMCVCVYVCVCVCVREREMRVNEQAGLVSLVSSFNGISTFIGYSIT